VASFCQDVPQTALYWRDRTSFEDIYMTLSKIRTYLYATAKYLGDVQAVKNGKVGKRIERRLAGKITGRMLGRLFKK
jgi:predicted lipoprotein